MELGGDIMTAEVEGWEPAFQHMCGSIGTLGPAHVWQHWNSGPLHVWQHWNSGTTTHVAALELWDHYTCGSIGTLGPVHMWQHRNPICAYRAFHILESSAQLCIPALISCTILLDIFGCQRSQPLTAVCPQLLSLSGSKDATI